MTLGERAIIFLQNISKEMYAEFYDNPIEKYYDNPTGPGFCCDLMIVTKRGEYIKRSVIGNSKAECANMVAIKIAYELGFTD